MTLLDGIGDIDWENLSHAYGNASDVPADLKALMSTDPKVYNRALDNLFGSIWHQGTVYQATRFSIPFLIQLLLSEKITMDVRISIIHLLASIADGAYIDSYNSSRSIEESTGEEKFVRGSILAEKDSIVLLLDHENLELNCNIFMLLAGFAEYAPEFFKILSYRYEVEKHVEGQKAILESIRILEINDFEKANFFRKVIEEQGNLELNAIAILCLIETQKRSLDSENMNLILDFVKFRVENGEMLHNIPSWKKLKGETTSIREIAKALIQISTPSSLDDFTNFIVLIKSPADVFDFVQKLFFHLFPNDLHSGIFQILSKENGRYKSKFVKRGPVEINLSNPTKYLDSKFEPILKLILQLPLFWEVESNMLNVFGLPHSKKEIAQLMVDLP